MKLRTVIPAVSALLLLAGCGRELYGREASDEIERRLRQKYDIEMSVKEAAAKMQSREGMPEEWFYSASFEDPDGGTYKAEVDGILRKGGKTVRDDYVEKWFAPIIKKKAFDVFRGSRDISIRNYEIICPAVKGKYMEPEQYEEYTVDENAGIKLYLTASADITEENLVERLHEITEQLEKEDVPYWISFINPYYQAYFYWHGSDKKGQWTESRIWSGIKETAFEEAG